MPHGYSKTTDIGGKLMYSKEHDDGRKTVVDLDKDPKMSDWKAFVKEEGALQRLGQYGTKKDAKRAAKRWMKANPTGLNRMIGGAGFKNTGSEKSPFPW